MPSRLMPLCVAPMMDWTDRNCRYFHRQISRHTLLYTEMLTTGAVLHGDRERLLGYEAAEHPVAIQLGGSEPEALAESARIAEAWGYAEVNLNVGCPSDRVQSGRFGACLMAEPELVARLVGAMRAAVKIPVTVKSRIAIDEMEEWPTLERFVRLVSAEGCTRFIVHARKAWLQGLSPKENRDVPPLRYDLVHRLKQELPHLDISINGGIKTLDAAAEHLAHVDGVMIGRAVYENPYLLAEADRRFFGAEEAPRERHEVVEAMLPYIERSRQRGAPLGAVTRHMLGLFQGLPGARAWRRHLSENAHKPGAGPEVVVAALAKVRREPEADVAA
ncbi:tRNA dihydrouridine(20/20a) synthase DusA [Myxococcus qinghaiensis]|uniref:tRNA dihydrouridine(20/20a) synthase DusA n=1 Tax=Myxococcus qinghaiensis TaxID=2906758 RepID=UPI0020A7CC58|nr:tRNA dihydrouridine(20/20a) synthase DusA [Myxococcus qinghaiensis]MCP3168674.1 tRNA dihydrouridine(20/20a) synthase DusA [Myxococcus qinghaiensis]